MSKAGKQLKTRCFVVERHDIALSRQPKSGRHLEREQAGWVEAVDVGPSSVGIEGESELGVASRAGSQAGSERSTRGFAHTDPVRSAQCRAHCIGILGAVGFEPALHPDVAALGFPDFD